MSTPFYDKGSVHPGIAQLQPYQPGKPIDELARELGLTDIVKLASNENPRGPGPQVQEAIAREAAALSLYPDGSGYQLKQGLQNYLGVDTNQITLGNGSNDVLDLVARCTLQPGFEAIISQHSFVVYRLAVAYVGATLVTVPAQNYGTDLNGMLAAITDKTRVIFIANPNNPTGTWVNKTQLEAFLSKVPANVWVVLDEAYIEFSSNPDYPNALDYLSQYPNLIVTRTFSKIHGLAALRIGYSVSHADFADLLNRARQPFNVNSLGLAAATAALQDTDFVDQSRAINDVGLQQITAGLDALGLPYIPSLGNFVTFDCGRPGPEVFQQLLHKGVIVRPVAEYELPNFIRVSVGLENQNERFLQALTEVLA